METTLDGPSKEETQPAVPVAGTWMTNGSLHGPRGICCANDSIFICDLNNNRICATSVYNMDEYWDEIGIGGQTGPRYGPQHEVALVRPRFIWPGLEDEFYITCTEKDVILEWRCGMISKKCGKGRGFRDGPGEEAQFQNPRGGCVDPNTGKIYVADFGNDRIRVIDLDNSVTSIGMGGRKNQDGAFKECGFSDPSNVYWDEATSTMFVIQDGSIRVLHLDSQTVSTFAGNGAYGYQDGPRVEARFSHLYDMKRGGENLYVTDNGNNKIRIIDPEGNVSTLVPEGYPDFFTQAPFCLTFTKLGDLVVTFAVGGLLKVLPNVIPSTEKRYDLLLLSERPSPLNASNASLQQQANVYVDIGQDISVHAALIDMAYPSLRLLTIGHSHPRIHLQSQDVISFLYSNSVPTGMSPLALIDLYTVFHKQKMVLEECGLAESLNASVLLALKSKLRSDPSHPLEKVFEYVAETAPTETYLFRFLVSILLSLKDSQSILARALELITASTNGRCADTLTSLVVELQGRPMAPVQRASDLHIRCATEALFLRTIEPSATDSESAPRVRRRIGGQALNQPQERLQQLPFKLPDPLPSSLQCNYVLVAADGIEVPCHDWVLFSRWSYFRNAMEAGGVEATEHRLELPSDSLSSLSLKYFLFYLYSGHSSQFHDNFLASLELLRSAKLLKLLSNDNPAKPEPGHEEVIGVCRQTLVRDSNVSTMVEAIGVMVDAGTRAGCNALASRAASYGVTLPEEVESSLEKIKVWKN